MERMTVEQALEKVEEFLDDQYWSPLMSEAREALATLRAELDGLRADAERYQLARRVLTLEAVAPLMRDYFRFGDFAYMKKVDAAIDAAREGERREG